MSLLSSIGEQRLLSVQQKVGWPTVYGLDYNDIRSGSGDHDIRVSLAERERKTPTGRGPCGTKPAKIKSMRARKKEKNRQHRPGRGRGRHPEEGDVGCDVTAHAADPTATSTISTDEREAILVLEIEVTGE